MSEKKNMLLGLKCEETGKLRNLCAYAMSTHDGINNDNARANNTKLMEIDELLLQLEYEDL
ncbi:hypothetical protein N7501_002309 [Penicillium viridicatum]|nr:hypothetical protein N7501_002309 [Penicillium viridicatum]